MNTAETDIEPPVFAPDGDDDEPQVAVMCVITTFDGYDYTARVSVPAAAPAADIARAWVNALLSASQLHSPDVHDAVKTHLNRKPR